MDTNTIFFIGSNQNGTKFKTLLIPAFVVYIYIYIFFFFLVTFISWLTKSLDVLQSAHRSSLPTSKEKKHLEEKGQKQPQEKTKDKKTKERWALPFFLPKRLHPTSILLIPTKLLTTTSFNSVAFNAFCFHWARYITVRWTCIFKVYINYSFWESSYGELKKLSKQLITFSFFIKIFLKRFINVCHKSIH